MSTYLDRPSRPEIPPRHHRVAVLLTAMGVVVRRDPNDPTGLLQYRDRRLILKVAHLLSR